VVVGDQGAQDRLAGLVVVPDGGGQGQQSLQHPDTDALNGRPAVALQVELALRVSLTDSMRCRNGLNSPWPGRGASPLSVGRRTRTP
jgi:hypothetical protein